MDEKSSGLTILHIKDDDCGIITGAKHRQHHSLELRKSIVRNFLTQAVEASPGTYQVVMARNEGQYTIGLQPMIQRPY